VDVATKAAQKALLGKYGGALQEGPAPPVSPERSQAYAELHVSWLHCISVTVRAYRVSF
jgi:hypothetical protein